MDDSIMVDTYHYTSVKPIKGTIPRVNSNANDVNDVDSSM